MPLALVPLALVLFYVITQGVTSLNLSFFTEMPKPVGETGGGMANAIVGSMVVTSLGAAFAIPIGIMSGIYAAEYSGTRLSNAVRFAADTLNGVPSIVIGVFVYSIAVLPFRQFSALAGGLALGVMMIPLIMRTTEELLLLVPSTLREGALALGATRARAVFTVVVPAALPGILTGILLALARIAGETAPLLFTALNNRFFSTDIRQPISTLTVQVFNYATHPMRTGIARPGPVPWSWSPWSLSARCSRVSQPHGWKSYSAAEFHSVPGGYAPVEGILSPLTAEQRHPPRPVSARNAKSFKTGHLTAAPADAMR